MKTLPKTNLPKSVTGSKWGLTHNLFYNPARKIQCNGYVDWTEPGYLYTNKHHRINYRGNWISFIVYLNSKTMIEMESCIKAEGISGELPSIEAAKTAIDNRIKSTLMDLDSTKIQAIKARAIIKRALDRKGKQQGFEYPAGTENLPVDSEEGRCLFDVLTSRRFNILRQRTILRILYSLAENQPEKERIVNYYDTSLLRKTKY